MTQTDNRLPDGSWAAPEIPRNPRRLYKLEVREGVAHDLARQRVRHAFGTGAHGDPTEAAIDGEIDRARREIEAEPAQRPGSSGE